MKNLMHELLMQKSNRHSHMHADVYEMMRMKSHVCATFVWGRRCATFMMKIHASIREMREWNLSELPCNLHQHRRKSCYRLIGKFYRLNVHSARDNTLVIDSFWILFLSIVVIIENKKWNLHGKFAHYQNNLNRIYSSSSSKCQIEKWIIENCIV